MGRTCYFAVFVIVAVLQAFRESSHSFRAQMRPFGCSQDCCGFCGFMCAS